MRKTLHVTLACMSLLGLLVMSPLQGTRATGSSGAWSFTGSMSIDRYYHTATLLINGKVLVAGGIDDGRITNTAELYDQSSGTWSLTASMNVARYGDTAILLSNGKVLVAGCIDGISSSNQITNTAELYDPSSGAWSITGSMSVARVYHTATLLSNGKVLVAGGIDGSNGSLTNTAELYDPSSGAWSLTSSMSVPRRFHTATLLSNGKVLVAGGTSFNGSDASNNTAELYDLSSGTWSFTGSMNVGRRLHTATLLSNGKVLVAGGIDTSNASSNTAELYDLSSGAWLITGSMNVGRQIHTATLLENGNVLVAGGQSFSSYSVNTAELYDPNSGIWSLTGSMNVARIYHTATLLQNGDVLVVGGGYINSAELYAGTDTTAPVLQLPSTITMNATSPAGATVAYSVTATDPDNPSSQLTISCSPTSGSTFSSGATTVTCTATDPSNNSTTGSFSVVVVGASGQITNLISLVNSFHLKRVIQARLDTQLQAAAAAGKSNVACRHMAVFSRQVKAYTGRSGITSSQAQQLTAAATTIRKVLGC